MLKKLLLTAALLSSTHGANTIDFTNVVNPEPTQAEPTQIVDLELSFTTHITSEAVVSSKHAATTHIILRGSVDFNPKFSNGTRRDVESNFKTVRTWFEGKPYNICFQFIRSYEKNGNAKVTLTTSTMDEGKTNLRFGDSTEAVLVFTKSGTLMCINTGQPNQPNKLLTLIVGNRDFKHGERPKPQKNEELNSYSSYRVTLDLRGLTLNLPKDSIETKAR